MNPYRSSTLGRARRHLISELTDSGLYDNREATAVARLVMEDLTGWSAVDQALRDSDSISVYIADKLKEMADRMLKGEPVQQILGYALWRGLKLKVDRSTLIPRPETAQLVDIIASHWRDKPDLRVLDACTGSGCIAIALARELPFSRVDAVDLSESALHVARINALNLKAKVNITNADVLKLPASDTPRYNIIVSNPPYIGWSEREEMDSRVTDYEPESALFVPETTPLIFYKALMTYASTSLLPGGCLYFEINPRFVKELRELSDEMLPRWTHTFERDITNRYRFLTLKRPNS